MPKKKTFEENLQELEAIVTKLENGDVALEDAIAAMPEPAKLTLEVEQNSNTISGCPAFSHSERISNS